MAREIDASSVGALDASAWIVGFDGVNRLHLLADPQGEPNAEAGRLNQQATFLGALAAAITADPVSDVLQGPDLSGARLTSAGSAAQVVVDRFTRETGASYGQITGHFTATVCAADGDAKPDASNCTSISGEFLTRVQLDEV